jgi:hypothetical protein
MTQLYLHPMIQDYFVEYDFTEVRRSPADGGPDDLRRRVMQDYAGEKLILLRNVRVDYDRAFISSLQLPPDWAFKKFQTRAVERRKFYFASRPKRALCKALFGGDIGRYLKFQGEVRRVNGALRSVLGELLTHHRVSEPDFVWRHTETRVENLHFDVDEGADGFEAVRLYLNMDDAPRIWQTTHPLSRLYRAFRSELELDHVQGPSERLLSILGRRLFGSWSTRGREQFPHHVALFEPGDVWLCDGRALPHQVIYGRRVVSSFYRLDNANLPDWHASLGQKLAAWRAAPPAAADPDVTGFRLPFPPGGPPAGVAEPQRDLKRNWQDAAAEALGPRLIRL